MDRAYTVAEIDALRRACEIRFVWGTTKEPVVGDGVFSYKGSYKEDEKFKAVEDMVRTYMIAGITADDIYKTDKGETP